MAQLKFEIIECNQIRIGNYKSVLNKCQQISNDLNSQLNIYN